MNNFIESTVDVDFYMQAASIMALTPIEVQYVVEYFEFVGESVEDAAIALDLNTSECIEEMYTLLKVFKTLQNTYYDA